MDTESLRQYILQHTDLAQRFPNWSASLNLSHLASVVFGDRQGGLQGPWTEAEQAEAQHLQEVSQYFKRYYLWIILVLGLPGNLASLLTFLHMRHLGSCVVYVAVLAVVDSLALAEKLLLSLLQQYEVPFTPASCKVLLFLANALVIYANWIVVALASERLFAVHRPLALSVYWSRSRAAAGLGALLVLSLLSCVPILVVTVPREDAQSCVYAAQHGDLARAWNWVNVALYGLLPCLCLLAVNVALISLLRHARQQQLHLCHATRGLSSSFTTPSSASSSSSSRTRADSQRQASVMLVVASFVLIVLTMPRCVLLLTQQLWRPHSIVVAARLRLLNQVTYALSDLNHAINFYLYFVSARHFRRRFLDLLRSCRGTTTPTLGRQSTHTTVQQRVSDSDPGLRFSQLSLGQRPARGHSRKTSGWQQAKTDNTDGL